MMSWKEYRDSLLSELERERRPWHRLQLGLMAGVTWPHLRRMMRASDDEQLRDAIRKAFGPA